MVTSDNAPPENTSPEDEPLERRVTHTRNRSHEKEYIVQVNENLINQLYSSVGFKESGFLCVRNPDSDLKPEIHTRYSVVDDRTYQADERENALVESDEIGLDFTLRYGLGVAAKADTSYGDAENAGVVELEPINNMEPSYLRRKLNWIIGVRPQLCRVKMGVLPDLEDKVCRLPENTLQILGIQEGDYICIESSSDIIRGVKAFSIDEDIEEAKRIQEKEQSEHYVNCWESLRLHRLRKPTVDIPEIYLDSETRFDLGLEDRGKNGGMGVCQPVRVYRDTVGVLTISAYDIAIPMALALLAGVIGTTGSIQFVFLGLALFMILFGYLIQHRSMLGGYGLDLSR